MGCGGQLAAAVSMKLKMDMRFLKDD